MKKWLGFFVILTALLIPTPAMAIGVSPYTASIDVSANSYTELVFTVTGCNEVDLYLEDIPLTVEPSRASVVDDKITVRILGNLSVPSGVYTGYLVILEHGQQIETEMKVSLTVNHINSQSVILSTTVLQPSSGWHDWGSGGGGYYVPPAPVVTPPVVTLPVITPPVIPPTVAPPAIEPEPEPSVAPPETSKPQQPGIDWLATVLIASLVCAIGLLAWYIIRKSRKPVAVE